MSITSYLTYNGDSISPPMWSICGPLLHSLSDWAADFIREISIPLHNYLSKGMPQFIQGSYNGRSWVEILLNTIKTNFEINVADNDSDEVYEPDVIVSSTLLSAFLLNAKISTPTAIDTLLPSIVNLIVTRLRTSSKSNSIKIKLLECLLACLYYNPYLTLQSIQSIGGSDATAYVFGLLFEQLKHMTRDATQRLVVVGMSSLLLLPVSELPAIISSNLNTIFVHMVREVTSIEETSAQQNQDDDGADDGGQDEDDGFEDGNDDGNNDDEDADGDFTAAGRLRRLQVPDGGFDEDEDCINVEDEEYLATLEQVAGVEGAKRSVYRNGELVGSATTGTENNDDDGGGEDEEEYDNDEEDEMYEVTLPVETMDMSLFLVQCLTTLGMNNPSLAVTLQQSLSAEDAARLQLIASVAATRQSESNT